MGYRSIRVQRRGNCAQVYFNGQHYQVCDNYGLSQYHFRAGSFNEDAQGRWCFNVVVEPSAAIDRICQALPCAANRVSRSKTRTFDEGQEIFLYCHSQEREAKESAMMESFCQKFEQGLQKLADGLLRPHGEKNHDKILLRIGRLKEKSHGVSQHYTVDLIVDNESKNVTVLKWIKTLCPDTRATHPGVYCLRTNELSWDEATLWRTYTQLTDLQCVQVGIDLGCKAAVTILTDKGG